MEGIGDSKGCSVCQKTRAAPTTYVYTKQVTIITNHPLDKVELKIKLYLYCCHIKAPQRFPLLYWVPSVLHGQKQAMWKSRHGMYVHYIGWCVYVLCIEQQNHSTCDKMVDFTCICLVCLLHYCCT